MSYVLIYNKEYKYIYSGWPDIKDDGVYKCMYGTGTCNLPYGNTETAGYGKHVTQQKPISNGDMKIDYVWSIYI